ASTAAASTLSLSLSFSGEITGGGRPRDPRRWTTSRRLADRKTAKFQKNITKRGSVPETTVKKGNDYPVGPLVLGFFIFVVIGSSLFQIIRTATSGGMA
ncbi:Os11g0637400, partial [Oryza sativa Japonica Group]